MTDCEHIKKTLESLPSLTGRMIHKTECTLCAWDSTRPEGLDLCLVCLNGSCPSGQKHTALHAKKTGHNVYLNIRQTVEKIESKLEEVSKVGINVEGGVSADQQKISFAYGLKCSECSIELATPESMQSFLTDLERSKSAYETSKIESWELQTVECKHSRQVGVNEVTRSSPESVKKCRSCDLTSNLWLCMTCGTCGCGRAQFGGSGGNGHALSHFAETGHPVCVKVGTLDASDGFRGASAYCYACDDEAAVRDVTGGLIKLGLDPQIFRKTEQSINEMTLQMNLNLELTRAFENKTVMHPLDKNVQPPGFVNIGNSCYINSLLQSLFSLPGFVEAGLKSAEHSLTCQKAPEECFACQFGKLANFVTAEEFKGHQGVKPFLFRRLVGRNHPEFKTERQQDVAEYFIHLKAFIAHVDSQLGLGIANNFSTKLKTLFTCSACSGYSLRQSECLLLPLRFPPDILAEVVKADQENPYRVDFSSLIEGGIYGDDEALTCSRCSGKKLFSSRTFISSFPKWVVLKVENFAVVKGQPQKLHFSILYNPETDLSPLDFAQLKLDPSNEIALKPEEADVNAETLAELESMGFPASRCRQALRESGNNFDNALNLLLSGAGDEQEEGESKSGASDPAQRFERLKSVAEEMGIESQLLKQALEISPQLSDDQLLDALLTEPEQFSITPDLAPKKYSLKAGVVHLGKLVNSGHYVAYGHRDLKEKKEWVYFNDDSVSGVTETKLGSSYLVFLERG